MKTPFNLERAKQDEPVYGGEGTYVQSYKFIGLSDPNVYYDYVVVENVFGDLFRFKPEYLYHKTPTQTKTYYTNLYLNQDNLPITVGKYDSLEEAKEWANRYNATYVRAVSYTVEEPQIPPKSTKTYYANLYRFSGIYRFGDINETSEIAKKWSDITSGFIKTISFEVEE
jgi:hypothetical protein